MKRLIVGLVAVLVFGFSLQATAVTLVEDFNNGVSLERWNMLHFDAADAPWSMLAPDQDGRLRILKSPDSDVNNLNVYAIIDSKFILDGDLSASIDFNLVDFPLSDRGGWNEAVIRLVGFNNNNHFQCLRFTDTAKDYAEGFSNQFPYVLGTTEDATSNGRLIVTRQGETLSALIDRGSGPVLLGSMDSPELLGPVKVQIFAAQIPHNELRPTTSLDVRFDNLVVEADSIIIPEPGTITLLLCGLASLALLRRRR